VINCSIYRNIFINKSLLKAFAKEGSFNIRSKQMEENNQQKKNKLQQIYHHAQTSFFNIMFELLKEKKTSKSKKHYI
jgi:hypothetical protein